MEPLPTLLQQNLIINDFSLDSLSYDYITNCEYLDNFSLDVVGLELPHKTLRLSNKFYNLNLQDFFDIDLLFNNSNQYYDFMKLEETS
jgi:hypothetical protein